MNSNLVLYLDADDYIEYKLWHNAGEDCDVSHDSETQIEVGTKETVVHIEDVTDAAIELDESDGDERKDASKLEPQDNDGDARPLAEVVKLPTPD